MKKQLSRQTRRSRPVSSKVQTNRRPTKVGSRKRIGSTVLAKKTNGVQQANPPKARSEKRVKPRNKNNGRAKAPGIDQAGPKDALIDRPDTENRDLMRHDGANEAGLINRSFNRTWLEWSSATMAANQRAMEELIRCKSPMDVLAVSSRLALRSWLNLWPPSRRPESRPSA